MPVVGCVSGRRCHIFRCNAKTCQQKTREVKRYLDTNDAKSTSNLRKHAKRCWGDEIVATADQAKNANEVRATTVSGALDSKSITAAFERKGKGKVTYSHRQHSKAEARAEIVRWVAESNRPFSIVSDRGFQSLMKTGRPGMYIPSPSTVSRDVRLVFNNAKTRIANMLQVSLWLLGIHLGITLPVGTRRHTQFRHRRMDLAQPQTVRRRHRALRELRQAHFDAARPCRGCHVPFGSEPGSCVCAHPGRIRNIR
jgi:hypothetical protein